MVYEEVKKFVDCCLSDNLELAKEYLNDKLFRNKTKEVSFLFLALEKKSYKISQYLLENGFKLDKVILFDNNRFKPIIHLLIEYQVEIAQEEAELPEDWFEAEKNVLELLKDTSILELIIKHNVDLEQVDSDGYNALDIAEIEKHEPAYDLLKNHGAKHSEKHVKYKEEIKQKYLRLKAQSEKGKK